MTGLTSLGRIESFRLSSVQAETAEAVGCDPVAMVALSCAPGFGWILRNPSAGEFSRLCRRRSD